MLPMTIMSKESYSVKEISLFQLNDDYDMDLSNALPHFPLMSGFLSFIQSKQYLELTHDFPPPDKVGS